MDVSVLRCLSHFKKKKKEKHIQFIIHKWAIKAKLDFHLQYHFARFLAVVESELTKL